MQDVWIKKIGEHRGAPRVFLDAAQAIRAGFSPGDRFEVQVADGKVVLSKNADGSQCVPVLLTALAELTGEPVDTEDIPEMLATVPSTLWALTAWPVGT